MPASRAEIAAPSRLRRVLLAILALTVLTAAGTAAVLLTTGNPEFARQPSADALPDAVIPD
ncbi:MAG: hypothetical protein M3R66_10490, partial [Actinomycetota bacterium]|nr:hypothetical protein [Actinomycetota bacterium]